MKSIDLWQYTIWLVAVRYLLPISVVAVFHITGLNFANIGIPYLSCILAAAVTGRLTARALEFMPKLPEILAFACVSSLLFFVVNYVAYFLLAASGIGPVNWHLWEFWHRTGHIAELLTWQLIFAVFSNSVIFWLAVKTELRAMAKHKTKERLS